MSTPFKITFRRPTAVAPPAVAGPSGQDFDSIVMDLCAVLAESDCSFEISGFGQYEWPVDVRYDLSTLMEQFPETLSQIRSGGSAEIDLYGQGVQRSLRFEPRGNGLVSVLCESRTDWTPEPATELTSYSDLLFMLKSVWSSRSRCDLSGRRSSKWSRSRDGSRSISAAVHSLLGTNGTITEQDRSSTLSVVGECGMP
jgi:hypothetical protein